MHFDYSELTKPVSFGERLRYLKTQPLYYKFTIGLLLAIVLILAVVAFASLPNLVDAMMAGDQNASQLLVITVISGVFVVITLLVLIQTLGNELREKRFAAANNLTFYTGSMNDGRNGLIFQTGNDRRFEALFTPSEGRIQEFGTYCFDTGSGKNRTTHYYGFVHLKLPRHLPNMVLDSHENNVLGQTGLPADLRRNQILHLEGDFDNHFTLYAPKEYEQDALYIFTPDVMQAIVDATHHYDSEIVDDDFYLYTTRLVVHDTASIEELLSVADRIVKQLDEQAGRYADERVGDAGQSGVAPSGARLNHSVVTASTVVILAVFIAYMILTVLYGHQ